MKTSDDGRCPKCGKPPPVRRVEGTPTDLVLTIGCNAEGCGTLYRVEAQALEVDDRPEAA